MCSVVLSGAICIILVQREPVPACRKAGAGVTVGPAAGELDLEVLRLDRRAEDLEAAGGCEATEAAGGNSKGTEGAEEDSRAF